MHNKSIFSKRTVNRDKAGWTKDQLNKVIYPNFDSVLDANQQSDSSQTGMGFDCQNFNSFEDVKAAMTKISDYQIGITSTEVRSYKTGVDAFPTLFLDFAELPLTNKDAVQRFVTEFGLLFPASGDAANDENQNVEPLAAWIYFQLELKNLIHIWRQFVRRKKESSPTLFNESRGKMTDFRFNNRRAYMDFPAIEFIRPKEVEKPDEQDAYKFIAKSFQQKLDRLISLTAPSHNIAGLKPRGATLMNSIGSFIQYDSFFGVVLSQFVDAIKHNKTFIRCLECGSWMEPSNKGKIYDTPSCKASAGRRRRELSLLFEVVDDFGELISKSLQKHFEITKERKGDSIEELFEFFEEQGVKKELRRRLLDLLVNTQNCLNIGVNSTLIVDHLGLGEEAAKLMKNMELFTVVSLRSEFQTAYYDWSWGVQAFETDPVKQGIGSLLLD